LKLSQSSYRNQPSLMQFCRV